MKMFDWLFRRKSISLDQLIQRLESINQTVSKIAVTPETALESPTVHAIDNAVSKAISTLPIHVYRKTMASDGRATKLPLPSHPVAKLLAKPNTRETATSYWLDAASWFLRYGNHYAQKGRGVTGPIRTLRPFVPSQVCIEQRDDLDLVFKVTLNSGTQVEIPASQMHHVRGRATDGIVGDSPVMKVREAIALEIAAERFGASFFGNGAMPMLVFQYVQGTAGFKTDEERKKFVDEFRDAYSNPSGRFKAMIVPKGMEVSDPISIDNDKAQFLATRQFQRSVIAGAFGVPPHIVGDLTRATYNNVEQQSLDFQQKVVHPIARAFESAMENDLLTPEDRAGGVIIRFNLDAELRGDFKTRQEGLNIQRMAGVISPNEWREKEGLNPISEEDGGDSYFLQGPSGQTGQQQPPEPNRPIDEGDQDGTEEN
jgi:HK97 family phage portal protein